MESEPDRYQTYDTEEEAEEAYFSEEACAYRNYLDSFLCFINKSSTDIYFQVPAL
jgi:hypothetical protein